MATTATPTTSTRTTQVQRGPEGPGPRSATGSIQVVDVKFCDLPGTWQHFSIPASTLDEDMFREGLGFDGSSIRGFQAINESDMLLLPGRLGERFRGSGAGGADTLADLRHLRPASPWSRTPATRASSRSRRRST